LWLGNFIGIIEFFIAEPFERVELVVALLYLIQSEATPAAISGVALLTLAAPVGIGAKALLELGEVRRGKRPAPLSDLGDIGPSVVDPDPFGRTAFGEEDDVGLGAFGVRTEGSARAAQHSMKVAIFHEDLEDLTGLVGEEDVIRYYDRSAAARLENRNHVLDEVELLVAGRDHEVVAGRGLICPLVPNGGFVSTTSKRSGGGTS
jgi:hypothetical protein